MHDKEYTILIAHHLIEPLNSSDLHHAIPHYGVVLLEKNLTLVFSCRSLKIHFSYDNEKFFKAPVANLKIMSRRA